MRTAEEIIYEHFSPDQVDDLEVFKQMINEARKECIRECADRFQIEEDSCYNNYITDESISSIINGLK